MRSGRNVFIFRCRPYTTFDMADIYGPAEEIFGRFLRQLEDERGTESRNQIQALTKWVPIPGVMTRKVVESNIEKSMKRIGVDKLDMIQFHWWDYSDKRYLDALIHLSELKDKGKIGELSLTNFNTCHLEEIAKIGIQISSNQIQYSVLDNRPSVKMSKFCQDNGITLLTYGTLAGGFLSEKYLNCKEPRREELYTASLQKYKQMIDAWGGWSLFQELLAALDKVAKSKGPDITIANVASRYILDQPAVSSIIIGCPFGVTGARHIKDNLRTLDLELKPSDFENLRQFFKKGSDLFKTTGDCGDEYRKI